MERVSSIHDVSVVGQMEQRCLAMVFFQAISDKSWHWFQYQFHGHWRSSACHHNQNLRLLRQKLFIIIEFIDKLTVEYLFYVTLFSHDVKNESDMKSAQKEHHFSVPAKESQYAGEKKPICQRKKPICQWKKAGEILSEIHSTRNTNYKLLNQINSVKIV